MHRVHGRLTLLVALGFWVRAGMSALLVLAKVAQMVAVCLVTWLATTAVCAHAFGRPPFTRRRWRALRSGMAECVGGPFDGTLIRTSRRHVLGFGLPAWPDVLYDATTRSHHLAPERSGHSRGLSAVAWAGWYAFRVVSDHYEWHPTGFEEYADQVLALDQEWRS